MSLLGNLFGMGLSRQRGYGSGSMWSRGSSRNRGYSGMGFGRSRASTGFFGSSLGRMAMGSAAAMLTRSLVNRRYRSY